MNEIISVNDITLKKLKEAADLLSEEASSLGKKTKEIVLIGDFLARLHDLFIPATEGDARKALAGWGKFYREVFGYRMDFFDLSLVSVPTWRIGASKLFFRPKNLKTSVIFDVCKKDLNVWEWQQYSGDNIDDYIIEERNSDNAHYTFWTENEPEVSPHLLGLSLEEFENNKMKLKGNTLGEFLLIFLKHYFETGEHLSVRTKTICSGTVFKNGSFPLVYSNGHRLFVTGISIEDLKETERKSEDKFPADAGIRTVITE